MYGPIHEVMAADHRRLDALLESATRDPAAFDHGAFERFRAGLLRHIGIEEKILLAGARRRGVTIVAAPRLREDHAVVGCLLVPTPDAELVAELRGVLVEHEALEELPGGFFDVCDDLYRAEREDVLGRIRAAKEPPLAPHFDGSGVHRTAASARASMGRSRRAL